MSKQSKFFSKSEKSINLSAFQYPNSATQAGNPSAVALYNIFVENNCYSFYASNYGEMKYFIPPDPVLDST
jgi:hypothetical protein